MLSFCPRKSRASCCVRTGDIVAQLGNAVEALAFRVVFVIGEYMMATGKQLVRCQLVFMIERTHVILFPYLPSTHSAFLVHYFWRVHVDRLTDRQRGPRLMNFSGILDFSHLTRQDSQGNWPQAMSKRMDENWG